MEDAIKPPSTPASPTIDDVRSVLVTGAAGRIGSSFAEYASDRYRLRLMVQNQEQERSVAPFGEVVIAELGDVQTLKECSKGIDTVVHLAADPDPSAPWSSLLPNNIIGTYNMMVAAKAAGCRRVVYASSVHAVSGYAADVQVKTSEPVNPGDLYGVSKCFGEALGRYMAEQEGLSCIALRIGAFQSDEGVRTVAGLQFLDSFVSHRDLVQLIGLCIDDETLTFAIFHGISDNRIKRLDISDARARLGYAPQDDITQLNEILRDVPLDQSLAYNLRDDTQESGLREDL